MAQQPFYFDHPDGRKVTIKMLKKELGLSHYCIYTRLVQLGWTVEQIIASPGPITSGPSVKKMYKEKARAKTRPAKQYTCNPGDIVMHGDKRVSVAQIIMDGSERDQVRSDITVCPIMSNGQILTRSPRSIGVDWQWAR